MVGKDLIMATLFGSGGGSSGSGGGGSGGGGLRMTSGSIQVAEDTVITKPNCFEVEHGLGAKPDLVVVVHSGTNITTSMSDIVCAMLQNRVFDAQGIERYKILSALKTTVVASTIAGTTEYAATENVFFFGVLRNTSAAKIYASCPLDWYAFRWEE